MKAEQVLVWALAGHTGVDFYVNQNHFQISNLGKGFWQRFFPMGSHPVRKDVSVQMIQHALDSATEFILYKNGGDFDIVSRSEFEQMVTSVLKS
jgi:hypothetical protein